MTSAAELTPLLHLGAGACAGIIAMSATYPMDLVRGRLTVQVFDACFNSNKSTALLNMPCVPQDDIVHGNLTVQENLWFSAKCRLPTSMLKPDRVLVVESVIESLGLQGSKKFLGQNRKEAWDLWRPEEASKRWSGNGDGTIAFDLRRTNIRFGQLRALRRETLKRVNVIMVVHQPR